MARKRMLSPEIWENEDVSEMSVLARLLFIGMISNADDYGKGKANPRLLKSKVFTFDDGITTDDVKDCLKEIAVHTSTVFYQNESNVYYQLVSWSDWQTVNRPSPSKIPDFDDVSSVRQIEYSSSTCGGTFSDDSVNTHEQFNAQKKEKEKRKESEGEENNICPELSTGLEHAEPPSIILPLLGDEEHPVFAKDIALWSELYPAVDVMQDLREMKGWLISNPKKKKTKSGINRFITNWLSKTQNRGGNLKAAPLNRKPGNMTTEQYMQSTEGWYE